MTSAAISIDASGLSRLGAALLSVVSATVPHDVLDDIGAMLTSQAQERISDTKVAPDGKPWANWSPAYARSRRGGAGSKLERSGALRESVQQLVEDLTVQVGSNLAYARRQQDGFNDTDSRGRKVAHPARPYLGVNEDALVQIREIIHAHYTQRFASVPS